MNTTELRRCRGCRRDLPLADFSTYDNGQGLRHRRKCRACRNDYQRLIRANGGTAPERPEVAEKACTDCKIVRPVTDFAMQRTSAGNLRRGSICRPCRARRCREWNRVNRTTKVRDRNLRKNYGIGLAEHTAMHTSQEGACAICGDSTMPIDPRTTEPYMLAVDHCHSCNAVRALLCPNCNNGLGCFREDPKRLLAAVEYLAKHVCHS